MIEPTLLKNEESAIFALRRLYQSFGYQQFKMSKFEEYDLYLRNKDFLVSDHVITFTDTNGRLMALKPDVTLSIVKNSKDIPGCVQKVYYNENVYRVSESSHSYKEIMQVGLECLGDVDDYAIAEVVSLAAKSLLEISTDSILDVSDLGLLSAALEETGVTGETRKALLRCMGEKNLHGMAALCAEAGVEPAKTLPLKALMSAYGTPAKVLATLKDSLPGDAWQTRLARLERILSVADAQNIRVDFSVVGDMNYYNGIVFKGFISGIPQSVLSGGQYDLLLQKSGRSAGAIGFALYLDLLEDWLTPKVDYDIDAVLLYDTNADLQQLAAAVASLTAKGLSVTAQRAIPEKIKYRQLLQLTGSEVKLLEANA
ncbi:MAG: ATP phosphoribosyltransferase regulatory subunit [Clostridia bacterium]|nr:ATP phosphoribosyltransferase regulatory subunit [Clostridia bacterium]